MARPPKQGIDYFQADVDMFQDRKIKRLLRSAGTKGFTIYIYLLTHIYRDKGYYYEWDTHSAFDISDELNLSENVVEETIKACCSIGLFNEALFSARSILSSESIQNRWHRIVKDAKRTETRIDAEVKIKEGKPVFLPEKTKKPPEETPPDSGDNPQSKKKNTKEKKSTLLVQGVAFDERSRISDIITQVDLAYKPETKEESYSLLVLHIWKDVNDLKPNNQITLKANLKNWHDSIRLMVQQDNRTIKEIWELWQWIRQDSFWSKNILSTDKLREKFDQLSIKTNQTNGTTSKTKGDRRIENLERYQ